MELSRLPVEFVCTLGSIKPVIVKRLPLEIIRPTVKSVYRTYNWLYRIGHLFASVGLIDILRFVVESLRILVKSMR